MNKVPILGILVCSFFFLAVDSCEGPDAAEQLHKEELTGQIFNTIEEGLGANSLSEEAKRAFQENAKRKLKEYADYASIYSDKSIDSIFRVNTREQMQSLFIDSVTLLAIRPDDNSGAPRKYELDFLGLRNQFDMEKLQLKFDSIEVKYKPESHDESVYIGKLVFSQTLVGIRAGVSTIIDRSLRECEFFVIRSKKEFVNGSQMTWKVYLGWPEKPGMNNSLP